MARVKVALPETFSVTVELPVRITDLNYGAHLGNDALVSLLHEARVQFLRHMELAEYDPATKQGMIMSDLAVEYKGEGFYGDVLRVQMAATDLHKYGFDVVYHIQTTEGRDIARAKTGMLCFDYNTRKLALLPEVAAARLGAPAA
ncbi:thioesterase family protein [Hymenobacter latericus]|uniref:thioesterase family protein n=1 Tax=Hymenobacter sp. YIM 151858-1 TaxID=2987688 RepID=UPI002226F664|nr:thioesterase family protein [Hymenobacter sp. YIM 151858-1]UYZ58101.1 thioesterase family protein [Hymenobacter sp. YIM 151858-1]